MLIYGVTCKFNIMNSRINIIDPIRERKSIRAFADKPIEEKKIQQLFEAARWAASCFNEQPWRFIYATKENETAYSDIFSTINEFNQSWAKNASLLMIAIAKKSFSMNDKPNKHAWYDTGAAVANLSIQATNLGLYVHQMAGFFPDKAKEILNIPEGYEAIAAIAVGYQGDASILSENLQAKESATRSRKAISEIAFEGKWDA